jgi:AraC family transcriptional regulator
MDWLDRMNNAMDYIETHLTEDISFDEAAKIACCSTYHFQRMFSFITDVAISEYIRRRRLTLAAFDLQVDNARVIDIALKYGYDSPKSFARAFKNLHGILPTSARNDGVMLKAYPRMTFRISIKGDKELLYRIEKKEKFDVFGTTESCSLYKQPFIEVPTFGIKCDDRCFGALFNEHLDLGTLSYMLCYYTPKGGIPDGFEHLSVPAKTWAVFPIGQTGQDRQDGKDGGISDIGEINKQAKQVWKDIFTQWLPTSQYTLDGEPYFENFYNLTNLTSVTSLTSDGKSKPAYTAEIWIPVKSK